MGVPSPGFHSGAWLLLMAQRRFAYPAGGPFLSRQKGTKERPKGFALGNPTRGFPLDLPKDGANAPYPLIPAGLLEDPLRGEYPLRLRLRGRRPAAEVWAHATSPKGSIFSAEKITEYGQLSGGLAPAGTPSPALRA